MLLLRELWATSPRRSAAVALLVVLGATGTALAAAAAGPVLVDRSWLMFTVLALALVASVGTDLAVGLVMAGLSADWSARVRRELCRVAFGQDLPTLENTPVGELLDRIDGDVYQVGSELRGNGVRLVQSLATAVASLLAMLFVWWPIGVGMLVLAALLVAGLRRPTAALTPARVREEEAWSDLAAVMEESIHGQDDIRTSLARPYVLRMYAQKASEVLSRAGVVFQQAARITAIASSATRISIGTVVVLGSWALVTGQVDGGRLTAIWLLALGFGQTAEQLSRIVPELQYALGAWNRIQLLRDSPQEPKQDTQPMAGDLELRDLTFRYAGRAAGAQEQPPALREVSLRFSRGRSYAVIGRTGSGKSTLAKVLTRAVDVPPGAVFLAGVDVATLDLEALRRWIGIVPQRTEIVAGTLVENITLYDPLLRDRAIRALDDLGLTSWVADLPGGVETRLGDGGHVLSAGQEQLVAFARILTRDPQVVILDEATARMDPVTEGRVQRATDRLLEGRIGIVIAHRLSSVLRCDEVVVLADGRVTESGPLRESEQFARLLARSHDVVPGTGRVPQQLSIGRQGGVAVAIAAEPGEELVETVPAPADLSTPGKTDPPPLAAPPPARTLREVARLALNDKRYGLGAIGFFLVMMLFGLDGAVLPYLWANLVDGAGSPWLPTLGIVAGLAITLPMPYWTSKLFPQWWVRQMLRISLRLVHGQTGPRRVSEHTPAEVVAQAGDTERVVELADNVMDQFVVLFLLVVMTAVSGSFVPGLFFGATILLSGLAASTFGPGLERSARRTVLARAAFATALVSTLSAARTVKLGGATSPVLTHLARLDRDRSDLQRREIVMQTWSRSTPSVVSGLLPIGAWALLLTGNLSSAATLVAVSVLGGARWFAWTTAHLVSALPSARVWTARTVAMTGVSSYSAPVLDVDIVAGSAPAPETALRHPLRRLDLSGFTAVHEDGTVGVEGVDLTVERGQLVLVVGPVGSGKSSLLRALAGIVHHTGELRWNGETIPEPELFLRPNQVGYVAQLPRVLSGTVADNVRLGHEVDAGHAIATARLEHDLAAGGPEAGMSLVIGHKGTRLSGGQLQRLALARALAPRTELLVADDVSSALDVTTELELWQALRERRVTVVGSTSKRAALAQADHVVVLIGGRAVAQGTWDSLSPTWSHLAG